MEKRTLVRRVFGTACMATGAVLVFACSTSSSGGGGTCASPGGAVSGQQDNHCVAPDGSQIVQVTTTAGCTDDDAGAGGDDGDDGGAAGDDGGAAGDDASTPDDGTCGNDDYQPAMYNSSGSDDDCKYDVSWTSTPICENTPVYFTVTATKRTDGSPLTGANARPDVVLACDHSIPNDPKPADPSPENSPGVYTVGPIAFDKPGRWVVRFHFNETCLDIADDSPHGHAAFWVDVP